MIHNQNKSQCDPHLGCGKFKLLSEFNKRQLRVSGPCSSVRPKRCRECTQHETACREVKAKTKRLKKLAAHGNANSERCMTCSPTNTRDDNEKTKNYINYIINEANITHRTFTIKQSVSLGSRTIAFLFKMPTPDQIDSVHNKLIDNEDQDVENHLIYNYIKLYNTLCTNIAGDFATHGSGECNTCRQHASFLSLLIGRPSSNNPTGLIFCNSTVNRNNNQNYARKAVEAMLHILTEINIPLGIHIISSCDPYVLTHIHSGNEPLHKRKEWMHYGARCDRKSDVGIDSELYQCAHSQYMWQAAEMLNGFSHQYNNWRASLQLIKNLIRGRCDDLPPSFCERIPYADKYIPLLDWMFELVNDWEAVGDYSSFMDQYLKEQLVITSAILRSDAYTTGVGQTIILNFSERHTIFNWLNNNKSATELRAMIVCNVNPIKYMNYNIVVPKTGQMIQALDMLGNFHMRMMLTEEAVTYGAYKLIGERANMHSINSLASNAHYKEASPGVANRMNSSSHEWNAKYVTNLTMFQLCQRIKNGMIWKLEVDTAINAVAYAATTNLDASKLCVPHPWSFINKENTLSFHFNQDKPNKYMDCLDQTSPNSAWGEVSHVYHIPTNDKYCIHIFILVDGREVLKHGNATGSKIPNCCFSAFLNTACRRTCGTAFEALNDTMDVIIPDGPLAIGIGVNMANATGGLAQSIQIRINDENRWRTITHSF